MARVMSIFEKVLLDKRQRGEVIYISIDSSVTSLQRHSKKDGTKKNKKD